jgi:hypothetical protein
MLDPTRRSAVSLSTRDRQQIHTRLAPVIGEQEAETLLDQFPSTADTQLVTVARLAETDHRIDMVELRLDAKIDGVETRLEAKIDTLVERLEKVIYKQMRIQTLLMISTIVAVLGLAARTNIFG